jgi:alkanesulfonate monooxygenase SsuD/methylene tetrahydromethanopterin reductase-like flavin-dependent oxidoreductase (luciferase family)
VERAAAAAAAGLDSLFVGDHHATGPVAYYQNSVILGRLLAEWSDRPAGALYLLPAWNPVLVAEQVGTLAALAAGPFVL